MKASDIVVSRWGARFMNRRFACSIGRGGIRQNKHEGDGASPVGVHRLVGMLYRPDRLTAPADWALPFGPADLWSDDPKDDAYNTMVRAPYAFSHERLSRPDPLYDVIVITDWNWPDAKANKGSAIFIHTWRKPRHPTAGCIGFARSDLLWIAARIQHQTRLIIRA